MVGSRFQRGQVAPRTPSRGCGRKPCQHLQLDRTAPCGPQRKTAQPCAERTCVTLSSKERIAVDTVHWIIEDGDDSFWMYMACGCADCHHGVERRGERSEADPTGSVFDSADGVGLRARTNDLRPSVARRRRESWFLPNDASASLIRVVFSSTRFRTGHVEASHRRP